MNEVGHHGELVPNHDLAAVRVGYVFRRHIRPDGVDAAFERRHLPAVVRQSMLHQLQEAEQFSTSSITDICWISVVVVVIGVGLSAGDAQPEIEEEVLRESARGTMSGGKGALSEGARVPWIHGHVHSPNECCKCAITR